MSKKQNKTVVQKDLVATTIASSNRPDSGAIRSIQQRKPSSTRIISSALSVMNDFKIGNFYELIITSEMAPLTVENKGLNSANLTNIGLGQLFGYYKIIVPNTQLGDKVKVKIIALKNSKFAFAKVVEFLHKTEVKSAFSVGDNVKVKIISKKDKIFIAKAIDASSVQDDTYFIIPRNQKEKKQNLLETAASDIALLENILKNELEIKVTRIQKVEDLNLFEKGFSSTIFDEKSSKLEMRSISSNLKESSKNITILFGELISSQSIKVASEFQKVNQFSKIGKKMNIILPKKAKIFGNLICLQTKQKNICFIKLGLDCKLGDKVRIKICSLSTKGTDSSAVRAIAESNRTVSIFFAKVIKKDPILLQKKQEKIKQNIEQMLKSGMHFGEKAVQCDAKMRDFIWIRKKGRNKNRPYLKKGRHFINLLKTRQCLTKALKRITKCAIKGRTFLFVGTKKSAANLISRAALFSQKSFFVNTRWLGGMLTNWKTILKSISKIRPILKEKQKIIQMILTKRQTIKSRLMKKIFVSMKYIQKGQQFLQYLKNKKNVSLSEDSNKSQFSEIKYIVTKRKEILQKGQQLLQKRQQLLQKRKQLQENSFHEKGIKLINKYENLLLQLTRQKQKLRELRTLLFIAFEIQKIKKTATSISVFFDAKSSKKVSNTGLKDSVYNSMNKTILNGPNPAKEILNLVVNIAREKITTEKNEANYRIIGLSRILNKLGTFTSYIKISIKKVYENILAILKKTTLLKEALKEIKAQQLLKESLKKRYITELHKIKTKLISEQKTLKLLKAKIKKAASEKRFLAFLPKLRYLPTATSDAANSVQMLMEKFVDPKLKVPAATLLDQIYEDKLRTKSKKIAAARKKKWQRLEKYFGGVANMLKMNKNKISKNVAIIIGQQEEMNAVRECQKLGIQMFHLVDTNCNPTLATHFVPTNDDSRNSIKYVLTKFITHIRMGQKLRLKLKQFS